MRFRPLRFARNVAIGTTVGVGAIYVWDQTLNKRTLSRTAKTLWCAAVIGFDYKMHFKDGQDIPALHERNALRLYNLIVENKGLYVKVGQSVAVQGSMLPTPYRVLLSKLFDDAPQDTWEECASTLTSELGGSPEQVFASIDHTPVASASIAQVHRGRLQSGEDVAIKIQHASIPVSTKWDLNTYKALMWIYDRFVFKMPMYFVGRYIADQVKEETDMTIELRNSQKMRELVEADPETKGDIYVPLVYPEYSTERILVMEWIDGVSLNNREEVERRNYDVKKALTSVFKTLTKEAFEWGVVHSDPHPGNWILRRQPHNTKHQQLVMIDHGLYVYLGEKLREEYSQLWRAMFRRDLPDITRITKEWGFGDPKLFASATMLRPYDDEVKNLGRGSFQKEEEVAQRFKNFLKDTERIPLQLIFVGRTQRILQGLNQLYGSPVNRMHLLVDAALRVPAHESDIRDSWRYPLSYRVIDWAYRRVMLLVADVVFFALRIQQYFTKQDPETALDESMQQNGIALLKD